MDAVRNAICIPSPAPLPSVPTIQTYWCIGPVCANANVIIDTAPQKISTLVIQEHCQVPPLILVTILLLSLTMTLLPFRTKLRDAARSCISACISVGELMSASVLSATRVVRGHLYLGYQELEGFFRRCYQAILNLPYELHSPILSASSSEDDYEVPNTGTDKTNHESQHPPIIDASPSTTNDSDVLSIVADEENVASEQSLMNDDTGHLGLTSQHSIIISESGTEQGSCMTTFDSSTFGPDTHKASSTGGHEPSNLSTVANEDKSSTRHESSLLGKMERNATSKVDISTPGRAVEEADCANQTVAPAVTGSAPNATAITPSILDTVGETSSS